MSFQALVANHICALGLRMSCQTLTESTAMFGSHWSTGTLWFTSSRSNQVVPPSVDRAG